MRRPLDPHPAPMPHTPSARHFAPAARRWGRVLALLVALATPLTALGQPGGPSVIWGQEVFLIPYRWAGTDDRSTITEVVLYVSKDNGASWNEVTRARPSVQSFMYRAPGDGTYAFAIRTRDAAGGVWPSDPLSPELQVTVDTVLPTIAEPRATITGDGRLTVEATAVDPHLDISSFTAAYQAAGTAGWTTLPATPTPMPGRGALLRATAQLPVGAQAVNVRFSVKDRAGNPASAGVSARPATSSYPAMRPLAAPGATVVPADPFTNSSAIASLAAPKATSAPPERPTPQPDWQTPAPAAQVWQPDNQPMPQVAQRAPAPPSTAPAAPNSTYRFAANTSGGTLPQASAQTLAPEKLLVNARRFELQYDLQSVGRWGVEEVEVWGTQDGGQSWRSFAIDTDQRSPVDIEAPGDGLYGFTIVVQSVGGLQKRPPKPGDRPDVLVEVDQVRPAAKLLSAAQPDGYFADHLVFTWQVQDANLTPRPISLLYAAKPSGPWQPIASNLENTGRYSWRLQRHLPSQVYLRLEARDRAGNLGVDQTGSPVAIHLPESTGRIRQVRPLE